MQGKFSIYRRLFAYLRPYPRAVALAYGGECDDRGVGKVQPEEAGDAEDDASGEKLRKDVPLFQKNEDCEQLNDAGDDVELARFFVRVRDVQYESGDERDCGDGGENG